jgi:hypothetical protein
MAGISIMDGPEWMQLDRCGDYNAKSHDDDESKNLKHDQIVAVTHALTVAPQSAAQLLRNIHFAEGPNKHIEPLLQASPPPLYAACCTRIAGAVNCQATGRLQLLFNIDSSFGSLARWQFADAKWNKFSLIATTIQVVATAPKQCPAFSSESINPGFFYLENHLISILNDYCKRKEAPENGYLDSSRLV